ncbi:MAG: TMEM43 family protein [Patescibacteria group bacterium]|nr:TMEM43 family protein [Patescibacteria group bacterium]
MADQFTQVTHKGWGSRITGSIKGVLFGLILFVASFVLIYWNEGRVDLSDIAKKATELDPTAITTEADIQGGMVSLTGDITSEQQLDDGLFLQPGEYVAYERIAEMYAWEEDEESESDTELGGGETTTTTYTYRKTWTEDPEDSSRFKRPSGHENPEMAVVGENGTVEDANIGAYTVNMQGIDLRNLQSLSLDESITNLTEGAKLEGGYVFIGKGSVSGPEVGDIRISYEVMRDGTNVTVFGKLNDSTIGAYFKDDTKLHYLYPGTRDAALANMHQEYLMALWAFRALGFILMWIGLMMLLAPLSVFLDVLPIMGKVSRSAVAFVTFLAALALSVVTMVVSALLHNPLALIVVLAVAVAGGVYYFERHRKSDDATEAGPTVTPTMQVNPQLAGYVAKARQSGMDDTKTKESLIGAGWPADQVDAALKSGAGVPPPPSPGA